MVVFVVVVVVIVTAAGSSASSDFDIETGFSGLKFLGKEVLAPINCVQSVCNSGYIHNRIGLP